MKQYVLIITIFAALAGQSQVQAMGVSKEALRNAWQQGYKAAQEALSKTASAVNPTQSTKSEARVGLEKTGNLVQGYLLGGASGLGIGYLKGEQAEYYRAMEAKKRLEDQIQAAEEAKRKKRIEDVLEADKR